jgi:hypothetical protein
VTCTGTALPLLLGLFTDTHNEYPEKCIRTLDDDNAKRNRDSDNIFSALLE